MYNLLEYNKNYSKTSASLWNYYRDEPNNPPPVVPGTDSPTFNYNADPITNSASFKYKNSFIGKTPNSYNDDNNVIKGVEMVVPLKHLGNFWDSLYISLVNSEVNLILTWSENCVSTDLITHVVVPAGINNLPRPVITAPASATFKITDIKLHVPVVTLSSENDNKLLEQLKTGFKRTIKWNKYRSEISNQTGNNNLNYLIDPAFIKVNRLFALSCKNDNKVENQSEDVRTSFKKYYVTKVEVKDFNVLIDGEPFFDIPIRNN